MKKAITAAVLAAALSVAAPTASAIVITDGTEPFSFSEAFGGTIAGLSAIIEFTFTGTSANAYEFDYVIYNTSSAPIDDSRVSTLGFDVDPTFNFALSSASGVLPNIFNGGNIPNVGNVELCVSGGGSCAGGGGLGVLDGTSGAGSFSIGFTTLPGSITLDNFGIRYQSINSATLNIRGGSGSGTSIDECTGPNCFDLDVPEPGTLVLLGASLLAFGLARRRAR